MIKPLASLSTGFDYLVNQLPGRLRRYRPDGLLPELCVTCLAGPARHGLCQGCRDDLPANHSSCCRCGLPLKLASPRHDLVCGACLKQPPAFDRAFIPWRYQFPVDRMIARYKYQGQRQFGRPLMADMSAHIQALLADQPERRPQLLVAAPMHRQRQRKRGFNQAAELAEAISAGTGIPWTDQLLRRGRAAPAQSGLDRKQRLNNLKGVFQLHGPVPAHLALVDDVVTTGATAATIAQILRRHGARTIEIWALARTPAPGPGLRQSSAHMAGDRQAGGEPR